MSIELKALLEGLSLTEDQQKLLDSAQENLNTTYSTELEEQKKGLLTKNTDLIERLKAAKEKADKAEGLDVDGYNTYLENKDKLEAEKLQAEQDALAAAGEWDKLKGDMTTSHETTIQTLTTSKDTEIAELTNALNKELIENVALKEIELVEGSSLLLMPHIKDSIQTYRDEAGQYHTKVVDSLGKDRMNTETGEPMKVSELIAEFQANEAFAGAFPIQNSGSSTTITVNGKKFNATNNPFDKSGKHFSITEQAKLNKTDPTLAKSLQEAAANN